MPVVALLSNKTLFKSFELSKETTSKSLNALIGKNGILSNEFT